MKLILMVLGLTLVLTFGAITAVQSYTPVSAGGGDTTQDDDGSFGGCHDDGDDDLPSNPEPVDDPDSEDNEEDAGPGERNDEVGDPEDEDPAYEEDDESPCVAVAVETESPSPCIPQEEGVSAESDPLCLCPDQAPAGPADPCICEIEQRGPGGQPDCACVSVVQPCCSIFTGDDVNAEGFCYCAPDGTDCCPVSNNTCLCYNFPEFGNLCNVEAVFTADTDCDGEVTVTDAYQTLIYVSGVEASLGADCGGGSPGDADCSEAVDAKDTVAILEIVAGLEEPAVC